MSDNTETNSSEKSEDVKEFDLDTYQRSIGLKREELQRKFSKQCADADLCRSTFNKEYYLNSCVAERHRLCAKFSQQCFEVDDEEFGCHYPSLAIDSDAEMDLANIENVYSSTT